MQRDGMFIGSFVAIAAAAGLMAVRQSIAVTPLPSKPEASHSAVDGSEAEGVFLQTGLPVSDKRIPTVAEKFMSKLPRITTGLTSDHDGFLGRRNATSDDGRQQMVFFWFKDKRSMMSWYERRLDKELLRPFFPSLAGKKPRFYDALAPKNPVMLVATLTPDAKTRLRPERLRVWHASFEVFASAAPALSMGPSFAPVS